MTNRFITVEGIEGVGKSSNLQFIAQHLAQAGITATFTREPGGTTLSEAIRGLLLDTQYKGMAHDTELLLVFAARAEHIAQLIRPQLALGNWVVCDRFTDATYAYQGGGRGLSQRTIAALERQVQGDLQPGLTILLDAPVEVALTRAGQRSRPDRFEQENRDFFARIRQTYLDRAEQHPERYRVIDASQILAVVQQSIGRVLDEVISQWR